MTRNFSGSPAESEQNEDAASGGGRQALDRLYSIAYEELRRIARSLKRDDLGVTLNPTALVNEAWVKLSLSRDLQFVSPLHAKRTVAQAMRHILADAARARSSEKRGGDAIFITLIDSLDTMSCDQQFLALHYALDDLAKLNPRQAMMVECRFFGGFEVAELSDLLGVSDVTIGRDWKAAKAWLAAEIRRKAR